MAENVKQVEQMISLKGERGIYYVTNFQYQLTTYGIEVWLKEQFNQAKLYFYYPQKNTKFYEN